MICVCLNVSALNGMLYAYQCFVLTYAIAILNHGKIIYNGTKENLHNIYNKKLLIITVNNDNNQLQTTFHNTNDIIIKDNQLFVNIKTNETINNIISILQKNNINITDINVKNTSLEDIFTNMIVNAI